MSKYYVSLTIKATIEANSIEEAEETAREINNFIEDNVQYAYTEEEDGVDFGHSVITVTSDK